MSPSRLLLLALGLALSAAAVFFLVRSIDISQAMRTLRGASPWWVSGGALVTLLGYYFRALRWSEILSPRVRPPVSRLFSAIMVGFLAINTLPARLGELVRAYVLGRTEKISTATVLGSLAVERVLDLVMLGVFWGLSLLLAPVPEWFRWSGLFAIGGGLAIGAMLWGLHSAGTRTSNWERWPIFSRLPARVKTAAVSALPNFGAGLQVFGRPAILTRAFAWSAAIWVTTGIVFLFVGESLGITLPYWSIFVLTFVVCVGISIPASPGFLGVMEGAVVLGLSLAGVGGPEALALAILYHVVQLLPLVVLGTYYAVRQHITLDVLRPGGRSRADGRRKERRQ